MKIIILGSTGFVGQNLIEALTPYYTVIKAARKPLDSSYIYFDVTERDSWQWVAQLDPDVIINASAYGVLKHESDIETMYLVNYLLISEFYDFLRVNQTKMFWLQIGTTFEYDLSLNGGITEQTNCLPRTHYGISKLMFSHFLLEKSSAGSHSVFRPFGMFGKYEDESKFFPMLIKAQHSRQAIKLSAGTQQRDYIFVGDLGEFIKSLILNNQFGKLPPVVNLGAGEAKSLKEYASVLSTTFGAFDPTLWEWNALDFRANESSLFYNSSTLAKNLGFKLSNLQKSFSKTTSYYFHRA